MMTTPTPIATIEMSRISRIYADVPVTAVTRTGGSAVIAGVDIALLPQRSSPDATTVWTEAAYDAGIATVLIAGPDADPGGGLQVPERGADVWARVVDTPEIDAAHVGRIDLL